MKNEYSLVTETFLKQPVNDAVETQSLASAEVKTIIPTSKTNLKIYKSRGTHANVYPSSFQKEDIKPGFVDTTMAKGPIFWMSSVNRAAELIFRAIQKKKAHAYITPRWRLVAWR